MARRAAARPQERGRELQGIGGPKRMQEEDPACALSHLPARLDLRPLFRQAAQDASRSLLIAWREDAVAPEARERRVAFDRRTPPGDERPIVLGDPPQARGRRLSQTKRDDGRGVPELHRPLRRSSTSTFTPAPRVALGRGIFQKPAGNRPEPIRTRPARASSASWAAVAAASRESGTILAIGRPRSVTITPSPTLTRARYSLSFALSRATAALLAMGSSSDDRDHTSRLILSWQKAASARSKAGDQRSL